MSEQFESHCRVIKRGLGQVQLKLASGLVGTVPESHCELRVTQPTSEYPFSLRMPRELAGQAGLLIDPPQS